MIFADCLISSLTSFLLCLADVCFSRLSIYNWKSTVHNFSPIYFSSRVADFIHSLLQKKKKELAQSLSFTLWLLQNSSK